MHSCESLAAPLVTPPASGPSLLRQLGRLIVRARSPVADRLQAKLRAANPSTSQVEQQNAEPAEPKSGVETQLDSHVQALWNDQIPVCIEVLLAPECEECCAALGRADDGAAFDAPLGRRRALLLERWTMRALHNKSHEAPAFTSSQWLLNAVRSQLHFSQLAAWLARLKRSKAGEEDPSERRRKLSRETCNYKKLEANCDEEDLSTEERKLNIVYSIKIPGESYKMAEFSRPPTDHNFPITNIGSNLYLKVALESLPRTEDIPTVKCTCQPKRRVSKEMPTNLHDELVVKLNDLTLGPRCSRYSDFAINSNIVDDRMLTPCSENGKHKCNCDEESDGNHRSSISVSPQEPKKLDERRLKEIAKYKRRLRKESKLKKLCDSTSSEGEQKTTHTSIPILQASRFDRFRAIGCYRNQTYLTLPASRIESKSPFVETEIIPPSEFKKTNTVSTQTEDISCQCGNVIQMKCDNCDRRMVRSEANYDLASMDKENGARRKCEEDDKALKKHKCDNSSSNLTCDINSVVDNSVSVKWEDESVIKRPKLRRVFPIVDRIEKIVADRTQKNTEEHREKDIEELNLRDDDTVFSVPKPEPKRQKTYSINEDYVLYENCDYGTFDRCDVDSPKEIPDQESFKFPESKSENQVPSPTEMDRFRWRFDSAASMVFHSKTGLPLTSSPAPLRRGNNCFDFDDSINGVSGIKSALFHPSASCELATTPRTPTPPPRRPEKPKLRVGSSTGLLGSFEESALKGRLEPVATVHGFTAELGASGAFCPPHRRLPVTVFFYAPGGTNAPYMGHINLGAGGYRVPRAGTVQVSLFNPHGTLVKMFVVLYELTRMPPRARTFLRQRTLYVPAAAPRHPPPDHRKWLRYLIHLRFMTSKSGKLYLHTDIRIIVSRKADLDTATAHSALYRPIQNNPQDNESDQKDKAANETGVANRSPNRVFGGCSDYNSELKSDYSEIGYENSPGVPYELRSFTYAPDNPKYSPR
ncbi:unnamed protein product [Parnassius mnemosyne]|uniref:Atos-like conserved domain-containing protein n=1 Tax=Parnassius mnemosyne TaxID=213953 RepID=A0AAV1LFF4_9NEOP